MKRAVKSKINILANINHSWMFGCLCNSFANIDNITFAEYWWNLHAATDYFIYASTSTHDYFTWVRLTPVIWSTDFASEASLVSWNRLTISGTPLRHATYSSYPDKLIEFNLPDGAWYGSDILLMWYTFLSCHAMVHLYCGSTKIG